MESHKLAEQFLKDTINARYDHSELFPTKSISATLWTCKQHIEADIQNHKDNVISLNILINILEQRISEAQERLTKL